MGIFSENSKAEYDKKYEKPRCQAGCLTSDIPVDVARTYQHRQAFVPMLMLGRMLCMCIQVCRGGRKRENKKGKHWRDMVRADGCERFYMKSGHSFLYKHLENSGTESDRNSGRKRERLKIAQYR